MDITLELDTRYHEGQTEKDSNQEKKPPVTGLNYLRSPQNLSSKKPHQTNNTKGKNFQGSKDKPHVTILNNVNRSIVSDKERRIK
ncbi:hypothetical protein O181_013706 [Austropuccinia psidii MF-1]|uniref:Uncharacterized protein n=1 Tax=Austropuccinia psidii MF-1 TaxID=1389203 RepID=A0A9Q3C0A7_9BASI|nr:hypothetical protein [Austropuccinia psidii MF-1]